MSNLKRNQIKLIDTVDTLLQERRTEYSERQRLFELLNDIREEVKLLHLKNEMVSINVAKFFPIAEQQQIYDFMSDKDGLYQARCNGFYEFLFNIRTPNKKTFADVLLPQLFTESYIATHHWPTIK